MSVLMQSRIRSDWGKWMDDSHSCTRTWLQRIAKLSDTDSISLISLQGRGSIYNADDCLSNWLVLATWNSSTEISITQSNTRPILLHRTNCDRAARRIYRRARALDSALHEACCMYVMAGALTLHCRKNSVKSCRFSYQARRQSRLYQSLHSRWECTFFTWCSARM